MKMQSKQQRIEYLKMAAYACKRYGKYNSQWRILGIKCYLEYRALRNK